MDDFSEKEQSTIQVSDYPSIRGSSATCCNTLCSCLRVVQANMYSKKKLQIDDRTVTIAIWDTAGQERFHALGPIYYRDANGMKNLCRVVYRDVRRPPADENADDSFAGALLVYDITDADTFQRVKHWVKELKSVVGEDIELVVCGNKSDLERNRQVQNDEALAYVLHFGWLFSEAAEGSANVDCMQIFRMQPLKLPTSYMSHRRCCCDVTSVGIANPWGRNTLSPPRSSTKTLLTHLLL